MDTDHKGGGVRSYCCWFFGDASPLAYDCAPSFTKETTREKTTPYQEEITELTAHVSMGDHGFAANVLGPIGSLQLGNSNLVSVAVPSSIFWWVIN